MGRDGHSHKTEKLGLDLDVGSLPFDPQEGSLLSIKWCIKILVHACLCRDANCLPSCHKMKRLVQHTSICERKTNGGCAICKQLAALCCYHAKHCQKTKCPVPFCLTVKQALKLRQFKQRVHQAQLLRRRMPVMNTGTSVPMSGLPGNSAPGVLASGAVSTASVIGGPQGAGGMVVGIPSHQPGIGLKPGTQTPPANVLQVVKQEEAVRQQAPHAEVGYGKVNPPGVLVGQPQVIPPSQMQRTIQMGPSVGGLHIIPMDQ
ncbi:CREB-binding protein [Anabrus simplex]|uniref:CREB-binding protein n=1 Tax=Anabrus simplex TaxID=316456 RepID=UPI0034DD378D